MCELVLQEPHIVERVVGPDKDGVPFEVRPARRVDHMDEGARLSEVVQELVAEAPALVGFGHEPRDVEELDGNQARAVLARRVVRLARSSDFDVRARLAHVRDASIRVDRREGVVCDLHRRQRRRREERRLADVRFPNDPQLHGATIGLPAQVPWRVPRPTHSLRRRRRARKETRVTVATAGKASSWNSGALITPPGVSNSGAGAWTVAFTGGVASPIPDQSVAAKTIRVRFVVGLIAREPSISTSSFARATPGRGTLVHPDDQVKSERDVTRPPSPRISNR